MTVYVRRDCEIHETDGGWFHAPWHFSLDHYRGQEQIGVGPLRVFNDDRLQPGAVWPMHPHRDIESCTYVAEDHFAHDDSLGNDSEHHAGAALTQTRPEPGRNNNPGPPGPVDAWPTLPLDEWRPTKATLHRFCQMAGKVRLALAPFHDHWWHVTLHVTDSHEVIALGFWPGDLPYPAYYSYTAPAPRDLTDQPLSTPRAFWNASSGTAILPYKPVRAAEDPRATLLTFLEAAYRAGARTAGWDIPHLATRAAPTARSDR